MQGSVLVRDPKFQERVVTETRALLSRWMNNQGDTQTCVVSYCGATAMPLVSAGRAVWANVLKCCESLVNAIVKKIATEVPASIFFKSIRPCRICKFPRLGS